MPISLQYCWSRMSFHRFACEMGASEYGATEKGEMNSVFMLQTMDNANDERRRCNEWTVDLEP